MGESENGECIWAKDVESAAKKYAEKWAAYEGRYENSDVWVRDGNSETAQHYEVNVEWLPYFSAALVKDGEAEEQR